MAKKIKITLLLLAAYILVFYVGFKSGAIYLRMKNKIQIERIAIPENPPSVPPPALYIIVERINYGTYSRENIEEINAKHPYIKIFNNEKLRHLLKSHDLEIYNDQGERIY